MSLENEELKGKIITGEDTENEDDLSDNENTYVYTQQQVSPYFTVTNTANNPNKNIDHGGNVILGEDDEEDDEELEQDQNEKIDNTSTQQTRRKSNNESETESKTKKKAIEENVNKNQQDHKIKYNNPKFLELNNNLQNHIYNAQVYNIKQLQNKDKLITNSLESSIYSIQDINTYYTQSKTNIDQLVKQINLSTTLLPSLIEN